MVVQSLMMSGGVGLVPSRTHYLPPGCLRRVPVNAASPRITTSSLKFSNFKGVQSICLSAGSSPLLSGGHSGLSRAVSKIPMQRRTVVSPRAFKEVPPIFRYPAMTKKPQWWWRSLACLPYLMPLHCTCFFAETAYTLHPFLERFDHMTYPFLQVIPKLPNWFLIAYVLLIYLGMVRRKEWPHFVRFHFLMGTLLDVLREIVVNVSVTFLPRSVYWGKIGMHFWTAFAFAFLFTVIESMWCALAGMYNDIPFVSDAAYMQIPFD